MSSADKAAPCLKEALRKRTFSLRCLRAVLLRKAAEECFHQRLLKLFL